MSNDTTNEVWRPVVGYEGLYEVSDFGRVMSIADKKKILKPDTSGQYRRVTLCNKGAHKRFCVHRLVAHAFIGEPTAPEVNHIDGDKENNNLNNLEYCTRIENVQHAHKMGLVTYTTGEINGMAKLNEIQVAEIRRLYAAGGISQKQIGKMYGVQQQAIQRIVRGKRWNHSY